MGERNTRQKDVIREALQGADDFISAQQLHARLEDAGEHIALATVYRQWAAAVQTVQRRRPSPSPHVRVVWQNGGDRSSERGVAAVRGSAT